MPDSWSTQPPEYSIVGAQSYQNGGNVLLLITECVSLPAERHFKQVQRPRTKSPKVLVLTVDRVLSDVGTAHNRVWTVLVRKGYRVFLVMRGRVGERGRKRDGLFVGVVPVPEAPIIQWVLLNLVLVARFWRERFDVILFSPRTWIAGTILQALGVSSKSILDIRSGPVHRNYLHRLFEKTELKFATIFSAADAITLLNQETRDYVIGPLAKRVPVALWGSGVDFELFDPTKSNPGNVDLPGSFLSGKIAIYHGSLAEDRGIVQLIEAIVQVRANGIDARLLLLGDGPIADVIRVRFRKLTEANIMVLHDPVRYEHVPAFLRLASTGVIPFPRSKKWETQMPLKMLEYVAMGKLVVATDMPAHEGYGQGIILIKDNKPETIAAGLVKTMTMPDDQRKIKIEDSLKKIQNLSWENQALKLHSVMMDLLQK